jgi:ADP-heptose:LPS heptosyltransferase
LDAGILVIASGGLGDAVMLAHVFPRLAALAELDERIVLILRRDARKMAFLFEGQAQVEYVDWDRYAMSWLFRHATRKRFAGRWRLVNNVDHLRHPLRDEHLTLALDADERIAMEPRSWPKYDAKLVANRKRYTRLYDSGPTHLDKIVRWARFADWIAGTERPLPSLHLREPQPVAQKLAYLIPFSAVREKQARPELFIAIAQRLAMTHKVVVAGAPGEDTKNADYAPLLAMADVTYDISDFETLASKLRAAHLVVSVDTGTMHLAVAMGAPTLCLASAAYVGEITPYAAEITPSNVRFVHVPMPCQGCLGACILPLEQERFACVARLGANEVMAALEAML